MSSVLDIIGEAQSALQTPRALMRAGLVSDLGGAYVKVSKLIDAVEEALEVFDDYPNATKTLREAFDRIGGDA